MIWVDFVLEILPKIHVKKFREIKTEICEFSEHEKIDQNVDICIWTFDEFLEETFLATFEDINIENWVRIGEIVADFLHQFLYRKRRENIWIILWRLCFQFHEKSQVKYFKLNFRLKSHLKALCFICTYIYVYHHNKILKWGLR